MQQKTVLLTIPVAIYNQLLSLCKLSSLEYAILTKAVVRGIDDDEEKAVNIFCDSDRAKTLLAWANQADPAAASQITVDSDQRESFGYKNS
jgi:hypothetical protein